MNGLASTSSSKEFIRPFVILTMSCFSMFLMVLLRYDIIISTETTGQIWSLLFTRDADLVHAESKDRQLFTPIPGPDDRTTHYVMQELPVESWTVKRDGTLVSLARANNSFSDLSTYVFSPICDPSLRLHRTLLARLLDITTRHWSVPSLPAPIPAPRVRRLVALPSIKTSEDASLHSESVALFSFIHQARLRYKGRISVREAALWGTLSFRGAT